MNGDCLRGFFSARDEDCINTNPAIALTEEYPGRALPFVASLREGATSGRALTALK